MIENIQPSDLESTLNYTLMNPPEYNYYQSTLNDNFMDHLEYMRYQLLLFQEYASEFKEDLVRILRDYLNDSKKITLEIFQQEWNLYCWMYPAIDLERSRVNLNWWNELGEEQKARERLKVSSESVIFTEFLYQITNTLYFVDLELDLKHNNNYKISEDEFKNYLKKVLEKITKFI